MLDVQNPPKTPGGKRKDISDVPGVDATPGSTPVNAPRAGDDQMPGATDATIASTADSLPPTPDDRVLPASYIALGFLGIGFLFFLIFIELFPPVWSEVAKWAVLWGIPAGLGFSFWKHKNEQHKAENIEKLNVYPGLKGLKEMLGTVPAWIHYEERERVEWLNSVLQQMWPFYDPAICEAVKASVEPLLDAYKPPGLIKKIYFRTLTFGDAPFKIDNVWIDKANSEEVCLEVGFRWAGEANIALAIEPIVSLGSVLRMVPKVSNLRMSGVWRIVMKPLIDDVPVVAGMVVAMKAPPQIHFTLEVGKQVGGALVVKPIMLWLDPFLRHTLTDLFVWPNRIVVPLSPDPNFDYSILEMRHVGLLTVEVVEARGLKKYDVMGKSDPFIELSTLPQSREKTSVKKKTLTPTWNETKHVLVQEPRTQFLRVEMFDHDLFQPKELLNLNIIKGATEMVGSQTLMGRAMVMIPKFADAPGELFDDWYDLGKGPWSNPDGCGQGEGELHLRIKYTPFDRFTRHPRESLTGALLIRLVSGDELPAKDGTTSDPFCTFKLGKHKEQKSWVISATLQPTWNQKFEFLNVDVNETLEISCIDDDMIGDELLGKFSFPIAERLKELPAGATEAKWEDNFHLTEVAVCDKRRTAPEATLKMTIQWIPYTYLDDSGNANQKKHHGLFHHKTKAVNA